MSNVLDKTSPEKVRSLPLKVAPGSTNVEASMISLAKTLYQQTEDIKAQDIVNGIMEAMHQAQEIELQVEMENIPIPDWMTTATWEKREERRRAYDTGKWSEHKSLDREYSKMARANKRKSFEIKLALILGIRDAVYRTKRRKVKVCRICTAPTDL